MENQLYEVRQNRGSARIWIEGARLTRAGFNPGDMFEIWEYAPRDLRLSLTPSGADGVKLRKVSGKEARPIIDLAGKSCGAFTPGDCVEIIYTQGEIRVCMRGGKDARSE